MQLEIEYRERLKMVNDEIKKRLVSKKNHLSFLGGWVYSVHLENLFGCLNVKGFCNFLYIKFFAICNYSLLTVNEDVCKIMYL